MNKTRVPKPILSGKGFDSEVEGQEKFLTVVSGWEYSAKMAKCTIPWVISHLKLDL